MEITAIKKGKRHLTAVTLSNGEELSLSTEFFEEQLLNTGSSLSEEDVKKLIKGSDNRRAFSRSVWQIEQGDLSQKSLEQKLKNAGFGSEAITYAVNRMKELGLIDDAALAERLAERMLASCISSREAVNKLVQKGIKRETATAAVNSFECEPRAQIKALIYKKYAGKLTNPENTKKVFAALVRKGFAYSDIKAELSAYSDEVKYSEDE